MNLMDELKVFYEELNNIQLNSTITMEVNELLGYINEVTTMWVKNGMPKMNHVENAYQTVKVSWKSLKDNVGKDPNILTKVAELETRMLALDLTANIIQKIIIFQDTQRRLTRETITKSINEVKAKK